MPFFTHVCRVIAVLGFIFSIFMFFVSYNTSKGSPELVRQSELDFKHGLTALLGSVVLGTLAEISLALHRRKDG